MLRISLITLRSFLNDTISTNQKKIIFPINICKNFHTCQKNLKKQGQWSTQDVKSEKINKKSVVKLYPGFQESIEEKSKKIANDEISGNIL